MGIFGSKHYLVGVETEYFILDKNGYVVNTCDEIIKEMKRQKDVKKEVAKNMIEVISNPKEDASNAVNDLLGKMKTVIDVAAKNDSKIFYYSTYPGAFNPEMRKDKRYALQEPLFKPEVWKIAGRVVGFHCHYTLVSGLFDKIAKNIRLLFHAGKNQSFVDSYNMLIALDPVFSTFTQSSPFYQGKLYGKNARIMFYRGNDFFGVEGKNTRMPIFGVLPEYKFVITEIMYLSEARVQKRAELLKEAGIDADPLEGFDSIYDVNWSPVKVNPIGTFEMRGMDMNRFEILMACAVLMKYALEAIQKEEIRVKVDDVGIKEPFKIEDEKVILPPFEHLNTVLQKNSAFKGMNDDNVRNYCKSFLKFVGDFLPADRKLFLKELKKMISKKTTASDEIIKEARKIGVRNVIDKEDAAELALKITSKMHYDIDKTENLISRFS